MRERSREKDWLEDNEKRNRKIMHMSEKRRQERSRDREDGKKEIEKRKRRVRIRR